MSWVVGILVIAGVVAVVVYLARSDARRTLADQPEAVPAEDADFPEVGEASPYRDDGEPVPGSADDRHRHGQP